jgi:hypothetical protein
MQKPLVAIQMIVFSNAVKTDGYEKVLRFIKNLGVNEIELSKVPVNKETFPVIQKLCQELSLHACAMNTRLNKDPGDETLNLEDDSGRNVSLCKQVGLPVHPSW